MCPVRTTVFLSENGKTPVAFGKQDAVSASVSWAESGEAPAEQSDQSQVDDNCAIRSHKCMTWQQRENC